MAGTYEPINTQTLTSNIADVYFTSIPQTYTDLVLVITAVAGGNTNAAWRVNNDNGNNYSTQQTYSTSSNTIGTSNAQDNFARFDNWGAIGTTGLYGCVVHFMNYSNTATHKTCINRSGNDGGPYPGTSFHVGTWRNTAAITSINILSQSGIWFATGSTFTLYGIRAA